MDAGPRAYYLASTHAVRMLARQGGGLIVGITDGYFESPSGTTDDGMSGIGQLGWSLSHQCINLLIKGMAGEPKKHKIAVVTLMPGFMRTERVARAMTTEKIKREFGHHQSESTEYIGRAVAALAGDRRVHTKSGQDSLHRRPGQGVWLYRRRRQAGPALQPVRRHVAQDYRTDSR